jgi:hypothetical protein
VVVDHHQPLVSVTVGSTQAETTTAVGGLKGADGLACGRSSLKRATIARDIPLGGRESGRGFRGLVHYVSSRNVSVDRS